MLYDYVETGKAENELTKKLDFAVYKARHNEEWGMEYLKEWQLLLEKKEEGIAEGIAEGIEQGIEQGIRMSIEKMLRNGKTVDEIVEFSGYEKALVEQVEKEMPITVD